MLKWLIKHSKWVLNKKGQLLSPQGLQQGVTRQFQGLRQLGMMQLQRKQQLQDLEQQLLLKQRIAQQDPLQQLLQQGQVAQAIQNISAAGGDVSQFQGLFGGGAGAGAGVQAPIAQPGIPAGRPAVTGAPIQPVAPGARPQEIVETEFERTPLGGIRATKFKDIALEKRQKQEEAKLKAKAEVLKLSEKARANFGRSIGLFSTMVSQAKGMQEEQKELLGKVGIETTGLGLLPGIAGTLAVKTRRPEAARVAAFRGQMRETAIGLNSILTGQNRVIRSVVQMIQETLPDPLDPEPMMATKLAQSITNAYKLVKAFEKASLSPDKMQQMSDMELGGIDARSLVALYTLSTKEEQEIDKIIDDVLATPAMKARKFGTFQQRQPRQTLPRGQEFTPEQIQAELQRRRGVR